MFLLPDLGREFPSRRPIIYRRSCFAFSSSSTLSFFHIFLHIFHISPHIFFIFSIYFLTYFTYSHIFDHIFRIYLHLLLPTRDWIFSKSQSLYGGGEFGIFPSPTAHIHEGRGSPEFSMSHGPYIGSGEVPRYEGGSWNFPSPRTCIDVSSLIYLKKLRK